MRSVHARSFFSFLKGGSGNDTIHISDSSAGHPTNGESHRHGLATASVDAGSGNDEIKLSGGLMRVNHTGEICGRH